MKLYGRFLYIWRFAVERIVLVKESLHGGLMYAVRLGMNDLRKGSQANRDPYT